MKKPEYRHFKDIYIIAFRVWLRLEYSKNKYVFMKHLKMNKCKNLNQNISYFHDSRLCLFAILFYLLT